MVNPNEHYDDEHVLRVPTPEERIAEQTAKLNAAQASERWARAQTAKTAAINYELLMMLGALGDDLGHVPEVRHWIKRKRDKLARLREDIHGGT